MSHAPLHYTPVAAVDPIAIFVAFIIIVNIISGLIRAARRRVSVQPQSSSVPTQQAAQVAQRAAQLAAARAAQRARLQQAVQAIQQQMQPASGAAAAPLVAPAVAALPEALPTFDYPSDLTGGLMPLTDLTAAPAAAAPPPTLPILSDRLTMPDLIVASAIIGPPASVRPPGHTPAGW